MPILIDRCKGTLKRALLVLKRALLWSGGIPIASLSIIAFGLFVLSIWKLTDNIGMYYLLSAISQGLAAILAIILSATLVAGQLASRYSPQLLGKALVKPSTISYICIFVASIVYPLVILTNRETVSSVILVKLSLILASACLGFLIPYFLSLKRWLDPRNLIDDLYNKASKQIQNRKDELPTETSTIREVAISLYSTKNYEGYTYGIRKLAQLVKEIVPPPEKVEKRIEDQEKVQEEEAGVEIPKVAYALIRVFRHMGILVQDDPLATEAVIKGLGDCAITVEALDINEEIVEGIKEVIHRMEKRGGEGSFESAAYILGGIGGDAVEKGQSTTARRILEVLGEMARLSTDNQWDKAARQAIIAIHSMSKKVIEMVDRFPELETVGKDAINKLGQYYSGNIVKGRLKPASEASWWLKDLGKKAFEKGLRNLVREFVYRMGTNAETTIATGNEDLTMKNIEVLIWYGKEAVSRFPEEAKQCVVCLSTIGSKVFEKHENLAQKVIGGIGMIGGEGGILQQKPEVLDKAITSLISLSEKINRTKGRLASLIAAQLWKFGGYAVKYLPGKQSSIKKGLNDIKNQIGVKALEKGFKFASKWTSCSTELSEFRKTI